MGLYNSSFTKVLSTLYPDFNWVTWKFDNCPRNYWVDKKNQRDFMDWASEQLNIKDMSDWYNKTIQVLEK